MKKIKIHDNTKLFFTSDTHFGHKNIIKYCDRPFESVEEMNETLIKNWNDTVPPDGIVIHMGDFAMGYSKLQEIESIVKRLNGQIHLTLGNHDTLEFLKGFTSIQEILRVKVADDEIGGIINIICNHYPQVVWDGKHRGYWHLYGHVHGIDLQYALKATMSMDVGVDAIKEWYRPLSYEEIKIKLTSQHFV